MRRSERLAVLKLWLFNRLPRALGWLVKRWRWWRWSLLLLVPVCVINVGVAVVGRCSVFPLSPFFPILTRRYRRMTLPPPESPLRAMPLP